MFSCLILHMHEHCIHLGWSTCIYAVCVWLTLPSTVINYFRIRISWISIHEWISSVAPMADFSFHFPQWSVVFTFFCCEFPDSTLRSNGQPDVHAGWQGRRCAQEWRLRRLWRGEPVHDHETDQSKRPRRAAGQSHVPGGRRQRPAIQQQHGAAAVGRPEFPGTHGRFEPLLPPTWRGSCHKPRGPSLRGAQAETGGSILRQSRWKSTKWRWRHWRKRSETNAPNNQHLSAACEQSRYLWRFLSFHLCLFHPSSNDKIRLFFKFAQKSVYTKNFLRFIELKYQRMHGSSGSCCPRRKLL